MRFHGKTMPGGLLHMQFLHHHAHIGGLVLILRVSLGALAQGDVVGLFVVGEKVRPKGFLRDADGCLADVLHGLRGAVEVEEGPFRDGLDDVVVVVVAAGNHADTLLLGEMLLHPGTEAGQRRGDGRDAERDALQRRVTPRLVIGREHREVEADEQVVIFHIEDAVLAVQIDRRIDDLDILFRRVVQPVAAQCVEDGVVVRVVEDVGDEAVGHGDAAHWLGHLGGNILLTTAVSGGNHEERHHRTVGVGVGDLLQTPDEHVDALVLELVAAAVDDQQGVVGDLGLHQRGGHL